VVRVVFVIVIGLIQAGAGSIGIGARAPLSKETRFDGPAILLFVPECGSIAAIPEMNLAVVGSGKCSPQVRRIADPGGQTAKAFGIAPGQRTAVLMDGGSFVRRVIRADSKEAFEAAVRADAKAWIHGKTIYDSQCARCHGADGLDTSYQGSKSLGGLGLRADEAGILDLTEKTGAVDLSGFTPEQRRALAVYVSGL
jgi:mono/diheme cytochrome c family protein